MKILGLSLCLCWLFWNYGQAVQCKKGPSDEIAPVQELPPPEFKEIAPPPPADDGSKKEITPPPPADESPTPVVKTLSPADRPPPEGFEAAEKLFASKKYALAEKQFEKFISLGVADVKTHLDLAYCLYYQRIYSKAVTQFAWVAKYAKAPAIQRSAEATARTLQCYRAGVCPGNCLKANDPRWQRLPDKDPNELWIRFPYSGGWSAWSQHHIGEVIEYQNGRPQNLGTCPICGGTGTVAVLKDGAPPPQ